MSKYDILLITLDSCNRNYLGVYNERASRERITPNLDRWSEKCLIFTSAFSSSVKTSASFLSILSGCYPSKYGDWYKSVSENRILISEILRENDYNTYGFTSNPCTSTLRGYNKGFDLFIDDNVLKTENKVKLALQMTYKTFFKNPYTTADEINSKIYSLFNESRSPFFLWIHYMDLHGPYISHTGWQLKNRILATKLWKKALAYPNKVTSKETQLLIDVYKQKMSFLDYHITRLIKTLDNNKTLIIITADHGDVFGERGLFGHPFFFYNEMINVPLLIKMPSIIKSSKHFYTSPVSINDIVPTIIDLLQLKINHKMDGDSLLPMIYGRIGDYRTEYVISEISRKNVCVIKGKWKLIADFSKQSFELYDIRNDYDEKNNLINTRSDVARELKNLIKYHISSNRMR